VNDERYTIISADMHAGASLAGYKPYLESRWHDEYDPLDEHPPESNLGMYLGALHPEHNVPYEFTGASHAV
jgi:hypothetical protein